MSSIAQSEKNEVSAKAANADPDPDPWQQQIKGWPPKPKSLKEKNIGYYFGLFSNAASIVAPIPFLILAGAAAGLHGHIATDRQWWWIYGAMSASVTLFPLVFTAIIGSTVKTTAGWRLERGTTLGFLEQLLASRSLLGALQTLWSLRVINLAGAALVTLAILSPLGGQSSLQMLKRSARSTPSVPKVAYLNKGAGSYSWFVGSSFWSAIPSLNAMYTSSLMAPGSVKNSTMDLWGNVKIPYLSRLGTAGNKTGWKDVPGQGVVYSSLAGIPIAGIPVVGNTTFTLETNYLDLDCYDIVKGANVTMVFPVPPNAMNMTNTYFGPGAAPAIGIDGMLEVSYGTPWEYINDTQTFPQRTLFFRSYSAATYCHISTEYVEAAIKCNGLSCIVASMRPSQKRHPDPHIVSLEFGFFLNNFFWQFGNISFQTAGDGYASSTIEYYLANPDDPFVNAGSKITSRINLYGTVTKDQMGARLGQVLNTYLLGGTSPFSIMRSNSFSSKPIDGNISVTAFSTVDKVVYVCQWGWWVIFVLTNLVLLGTASLGAFLHRRCTGPDILGYVSSMTRDSPYVRLPSGGSSLDGMERARLLKELRVQMRDIQDGEEVGQIAFTSADVKSGVVVGDKQYS